MTASLDLLLRSVDLPESAAGEVVARYSGRYASSLAFNQSLGDAGVTLLDQQLSTDGVVELVGEGSRLVLDRILASKEQRSEVLLAVLASWWLCPADQQRFLQRRLGRGVLEAMWQYRYMEPEIFELLSEYDPDNDDEYLGCWYVDPECAQWLDDDPAHSRCYWRPASWVSRFAGVTRLAEVLASTPREYTGQHQRACTFSATLGSALVHLLGSDPATWTTFLDLFESLPDANVREIVDVAKRVGVLVG